MNEWIEVSVAKIIKLLAELHLPAMNIMLSKYSVNCNQMKIHAEIWYESSNAHLWMLHGRCMQSILIHCNELVEH